MIFMHVFITVAVFGIKEDNHAFSKASKEDVLKE